VPPGPPRDLAQLVRSEVQPVKPRRHAIAVAQAQADGHIVDAVGHEDGTRIGDRREPRQQLPSALRRTDDPEVAAHQQKPVEPAQCHVHVLGGELTGVLHATPARNLDGAGRDVDRDDREPGMLQVKRVTTGAAADIEYSAGHE